MIVVVAIIIFVVFEILEDVIIEGKPLTGGSWVWFWNAIVYVTRNVTDAVSSWGYLGIFFLMLLESSSLPVPSEVVLPFAGYLVSIGKLNFMTILFAATVAGISGSLVDYYIGIKGWEYLNRTKTTGRILFGKNQLEIAAGWFKKYGTIVVFFSRLVPGFRTIVSFPAGAVRMSLVKFIAYTFAGCLVWNMLLIYLGYFLGSNWTQVAGFSHYVLIALIVVFVCGILGYYIWRRKSKKDLANP